MFDFEKLVVYQKAKEFNLEIKNEILAIEAIQKVPRDQLRRASLSIVLNIAEGTSRFSNADKRNFYVISRGSVFECVAILDLFTSENTITQEIYDYFYSRAEELSKLLYSLIKGAESKNV